MGEHFTILYILQFISHDGIACQWDDELMLINSVMKLSDMNCLRNKTQKSEKKLAEVIASSISGRGNRIGPVCVGLWEIRCASSHEVQDYVVHHRHALCTTDLHCAPWCTRGTCVVSLSVHLDLWDLRCAPLHGYRTMLSTTDLRCAYICVYVSIQHNKSNVYWGDTRGAWTLRNKTQNKTQWATLHPHKKMKQFVFTMATNLDM